MMKKSYLPVCWHLRLFSPPVIVTRPMWEMCYDQVVHVASTRNAHIFGGAVVTHNPVKNFVGDAQDYIIATKHTIGDMLISGLTIGIYTPSTTKYYVRKDNPNVVIEKQKTKKTFKGHLK